MSIIKVEKRYNYTTIINSTINDMDLGWDTLGLFVYLISKPPGWRVDVEYLANLKRGGVGRKAILRMLKNMEEAGYLYRSRERGPNGRFVWVRTLYEAKDENPLFHEQPGLFDDHSPQSPEGTMEVQAQNGSEPPQSPEGTMEVQAQNGLESPQSPEPPVAEGTILVNKEIVKETDLSLVSSNKHHQDRINDQGPHDEKIGGGGDDFSIWDAFRLAGIRTRTARRIPEAWKRATGKDLTPEDILAWHFYREAYNTGLPPARRMREGAIVTALEDGDRADETYYEQAREFLCEQGLTDAVEDETRSAAEKSPPNEDALQVEAIRAALEAYLPRLMDVGIDAFDAMRAALPEIARDLHARGVTDADLNDLHLYLTYMKQPIPRPEAVADVLERVMADPDFQTWRERKTEAERLWRHIVQKSGFAFDSVVGQAMRKATPVDLNGALVILADSQLHTYFQLYWQQKSAYLLNDTAYPEDLPIQFIPHET